jgi:hypothetical protein
MFYASRHEPELSAQALALASFVYGRFCHKRASSFSGILQSARCMPLNQLIESALQV